MLLDGFALQNFAHILSNQSSWRNKMKKRGECTITKARHCNVSLPNYVIAYSIDDQPQKILMLQITM